MRYIPHEYQAVCTELALSRSSVGLFLKPGLGKTVITLTALEELICNRLEYASALIIAPKRVCEDVWPEEIKKWDHLRHMSYSLVLGTEAERLAALRKKVAVYIINRENFVWLAKTLTRWPFKIVVIDELSNFKNSKSLRFHAFKKIRHYVERVIGLTGTPRPNSDLDLWAEIYCLDAGLRLGKNITGYKKQYFYQPNPYQPYRWEAQVGAAKVIQDKIKDLCVSMRAEDYLRLPALTIVERDVVLPADLQRSYRKFEREMVLSVDDETITAPSRAIVINKLLQFANGAIYDEERKVHSIHDAKTEALKELVEEANGQPVLVFYNFRHDLERIKTALREYDPRELESSDDVKDWNEGRIKVLLAHPASCGYGLNLQAGGHLIVWFSLTWSQEQYEQANARLHRQGQREPVIVHHLIAKGTADELVLAALERKQCGQNELFEALKARVSR